MKNIATRLPTRLYASQSSCFITNESRTVAGMRLVLDGLSNIRQRRRRAAVLLLLAPQFKPRSSRACCTRCCTKCRGQLRKPEQVGAKVKRGVETRCATGRYTWCWSYEKLVVNRGEPRCLAVGADVTVTVGSPVASFLHDAFHLRLRRRFV